MNIREISFHVKILNQPFLSILNDNTSEQVGVSDGMNLLFSAIWCCCDQGSVNSTAPQSSSHAQVPIVLDAASKIAPGKKTLQPQRGSYLIPNRPSSPPDEKSDACSPWELCFFLEGEIYEAIFIPSLGPICERGLYQPKQVQRRSACFGDRMWEGVLSPSCL